MIMIICVQAISKWNREIFYIKGFNPYKGFKIIDFMPKNE